MEAVRVEFVGAVALSSAAVAQFVQALKDVPPGVECEIAEIRCRRVKGGTESVVRLLVAPHVAAFLCQRFTQQTRHIARGELLLVRCRRIHDGPASARIASVRMPPTGVETAASKAGASAAVKVQSSDRASQPSLPPPALPMDKVVALIDVLGDQIADAHAVYELFALRDASPPLRLSLLGLSKAMTRLCEKEWIVKQSADAAPSSQSRQQRQPQQPSSDDSTPQFATVSSLRSLLAKLIASSGVAMTALPASPTAACISYTDFLACYVALLHSIHASATCA